MDNCLLFKHLFGLCYLLQQGWDKRPGVRILFGRWQEVLPQLGTYDGIFFDTYGEYDQEIHYFHEQLPRLLKPSGVYSFFNGFASDNFFFHSVTSRWAPNQGPR
jgi:protein arginine N-methyltransferase 2